MGNHRFRLSDMVPNAWFHKLKVMSRASRNPTFQHATKKSQPTRPGGPFTPKPLPPAHPDADQPYLQPRRASYYFPSRQEKPPGSPSHPRAVDTHFPIETPRKSKKKGRRKQGRPSQRLVSSVSANSWSCRAAHGAVWEGDAMPVLPTAPGSRPYGKECPEDDSSGMPCFDKLVIAEHYGNSEGVEAWSESYSCKDFSPADDAVMDERSCKVVSPTNDLVMEIGSSSSSTGKFEELDLQPILTKPVHKAAEATKLDGGRSMSSKAKNCHKLGCSPPLRDAQKSTLRRPSSTASQGLRMRATSPRLASKKIRAHRGRKTAASTPRKCLLDSFAVVKSSSDPQRDFRDSMIEMIAENNIRTSTDLEDLLACYLSLNSNEYHDVIVKVFEQIWFDLTDVIRCQEVHRLSRRR